MEYIVPEFVEWAPIPRLKRGCVITEKIDGTNAQICISDGVPEEYKVGDTDYCIAVVPGGIYGYRIFAGSRNRWLSPDAGKTNDNFGFAKWVKLHAEELAKLGPGRHYGEWWGYGIQRGYGLQPGDKRFSLFNTSRYKHAPPPDCCGIVPVLYQGEFTTNVVDEALATLKAYGSMAAPGYMNPEGVVVFLPQSHHLYKVTLENDDVPKSQVQPQVTAPV